MSDKPSEDNKLDPDLPTATSYTTAPQQPVRHERRPLPSTVGAYRIVALLGEGGMGTVYQAEQQNPHRTVALKVIKLGVASGQLLRRFEQEAEALGRLQHPGIAQIYEAGTADTGQGPQPYFAMEFIQGRPLIDYAAERRLNVRARLELIGRICDAVNHAHQRGIIHRDLKPGNILVDETGQPKILDFGVARVTDSDAQATRQTDMGQLIGTLAYMSPEQVQADPLAVDIRSDVYALGVILYELLAGKLPYDINRKAIHEAVQTIREEDPAPLSSIHRSYRGDIDTIVAKALEKDKTRRYASAADLAGDLRRYLTDEPIVARPPSASYQLQKFARRHKALVTGTAAVFLVLAGGVVVSTWETVRARKAERSAVQQRDRAITAEARAQQERNTALSEKRRADAEAAASKAVNDFLQNDLLAQASAANQAGPNAKPDPDLKVRTALERAAAGIQGKFEKQPLVEASIRQTIGDTYRDLGLYSEAERQLERALELRRRVQGEQQEDTVASMVDLADLYDRRNKVPQAEALYEKALGIRRQLLGDDNPATLAILRGLAEMYERRGRHVEAESLFTKVIAVQRRTLGEGHPDSLSSMEGLATLYVNSGKFEKAEQLYAKVQEVRRRTLGEEHPSFLNTESDVAELYRSEGKYAAAEKLYLKVLEIRRRVLGKEHPDTLNTMNNLAGVYVGQGKFKEAEALHSAVVEIDRRVLGEQHRDTLLGMNNLALVYYRQSKYEQAEALWKRVLETQTRVLGEEHRDTLITMNNLGGVYRIQRKYSEAEAMLKRATELQTRVLGAEHPNTLYTVSGLGVLYRSQGKYAEAEPLFKRVLEVRRRVLGAQHPETLDSIHNLATVYIDEGKYEEAESRLNSLVEVRRRVQGEESEETLYTLNNQATLYREEGKYTEAEPLFSKVFEVRRRALGAEHFATLDAMVSLGQVRLQQQKYSDAESILRQALSNYEKKNLDVWRRYQCQALLGATLGSQQKYEEAESMQVAGYKGMLQRESTIPFEARSALDKAREQIVKLYEAWGKPEKAAEFRHN